MKFHISCCVPATAPWGQTAMQLQRQLVDMDFAGPADLVETLDDHFTKHDLPLHTTTVSGVILVSAPTGFILRIRSHT